MVCHTHSFFFFFFFNDTATTEIYTLSLHDALPILPPTAAPGCSMSSRPRRSTARPEPSHGAVHASRRPRRAWTTKPRRRPNIPGPTTSPAPSAGRLPRRPARWRWAKLCRPVSGQLEASPCTQPSKQRPPGFHRDADACYRASSVLPFQGLITPKTPGHSARFTHLIARAQPCTTMYTHASPDYSEPGPRWLADCRALPSLQLVIAVCRRVAGFSSNRGH